MITPSTKRRVRAVARQVGDELPQPSGIDREQRQDRAELDQHLEGLAGVLEAEQRPARSRCAVDETGMNSVTPSTMPRIRASTIVLSCIGLPVRTLVAGRRRIALFRPASRSYPNSGGPVLYHRPAGFPSLEHDRSHRLMPDSPPLSPLRRLPPRPPHSRRIRRGPRSFVEELPWERREELLALNPAGTLPILIDETDGPIVGADGHRRISRTRPAAAASARTTLMPPMPPERAEVRRLVAWFLDKLDAEVTGYLVSEKIFKRHAPAGSGGGPPDAAAIRAARANIRYHLRYIGYLASRRNCLAGAGSELCRPRRGGGAVLHRLSGRSAMGRGRNGEALVRADEVAPELPPAAHRHDPRHPALDPLRRPRLLSQGHRPTAQSALLADATAEGFDVVRVASPDATPETAERLRQFLADGHHGDDGVAGDHGRPARATRARCGRRPARSSCSASTTGRSAIRWRASRRSDRATISVYARNRDYHDLIKGKLKRLAQRFAARTRQRGEGLRRYRAADGKAARRSGRHRLAGQAHQPRQPRVRLLAVPRRDPDRARPAAPTRPRRSLRHVPRLPRHLPDQRLPGALSARCAALHLLSHHRARRARSRANSARRWATASMAATIALPSARGTSSRESRREAKLAARDDLAAPPLADLAALDDAGFPGAVSPARRSSASAATASCAMC